MPAVAEASNLRDLLKVRDEDAGDEHRRRNAVAKITLAAVLGSERRNGGDGGDGGGSPMSRTLLDIIREESSASASVGDYSNNSNSTNRMGWKTFKDRLLLRRAGAAWTSSVHIPASDVPMRTISSSSSSRSRAQMISRQQSTRFPTTVPAADESLPAQTEDDALSPPLPPTENAPPSGGRGQISRLSSTRFPRVTFILDDPDRRASDEPPSTSRYRESESVAEGEAEGEEEEEEEEGGGRERDEGPVRMSLMDLLEETDRQMGVAGPVYRAEAGEQEEEEDEEEEVEDGGGEGLQGEYNCCVCMVRHKGAAFIPCGHTFCRLCSRELWVSRGNCPICNGFILEVLDIF